MPAGHVQMLTTVILISLFKHMRKAQIQKKLERRILCSSLPSSVLKISSQYLYFQTASELPLSLSHLTFGNILDSSLSIEALSILHLRFSIHI